MNIHTRSKAELLAMNPECADCGRKVQRAEGEESLPVVIVSNHLLCVPCAESLRRCSPQEWKQRVGSYALKRLVPPSEIGSFDIRSDPAFVFTSLEEVTRDHWAEMVKRLHGFARSIINNRTGSANAKLTSEIATKIVRGMIEGAAQRSQWEPDHCPNLLRWLVDSMKAEIDLLIPDIPSPHVSRPHRKPWQTIVLPTDKQQSHTISLREVRELFAG
jgi:hypothetical protein